MKRPFTTREWVRAVANELNLSISAMAQAAGLSPSSLTRWLNDPSEQLTLRESTVEKIERFAGIPRDRLPGGHAIPGMAEADAQKWEPERPDGTPWSRAAIEAAVGSRNGVVPWVMKTRVLDMAGILPGDILLVDHNRRAKAGDIVCAQVIDYITGNAETVFRLYQTPFLMTHSATQPVGRPEQVDDNRVSITGVVDGVIRVS